MSDAFVKVTEPVLLLVRSGNLILFAKTCFKQFEVIDVNGVAQTLLTPLIHVLLDYDLIVFHVARTVNVRVRYVLQVLSGVRSFIQVVLHQRLHLLVLCLLRLSSFVVVVETKSIELATLLFDLWHLQKLVGRVLLFE